MCTTRISPFIKRSNALEEVESFHDTDDEFSHSIKLNFRFFSVIKPAGTDFIFAFFCGFMVIFVKCFELNTCFHPQLKKNNSNSN